MKAAKIILAASVLAAASGACIADANSDAKKAIQGGMNKAMQLMISGQYDALAKMCTPDCTFTDNGQTMNVKQALASMKGQMAHLKDLKMSATVLTCKVKGNIAICTSHDTMSASMMGPDKKWHKMTEDGTATDTFQKSGGTWLMKNETSGGEKMTLDGKPYDPRAAMGAAGAPKKK